MPHSLITDIGEKMRKTFVLGLGISLMLLMFAGVSEVATVTDKFELTLWNGQYYAKARMPDGALQEIKSAEDLTYSQWKAKIQKAWEDSQKPPDLTVLYETDTYAIRDPNNGNLVLEWKPDNLRLNVTKKNLVDLTDSTKKMGELFVKIP